MVQAFGTRGSPKMDASSFYFRCLSFLTSGKLAEIAPWIAANGIWNDAYLDSLFNLSKAGCFDYVGIVGRYVRSRGGLKGCMVSAGNPGGGFVSGSAVFGPEDKNKRKTLAAPWWQVVRYDKDRLAAAVTSLKKVLDAGHVVRAGVLSGIAGSLSNPDHYILVIGYDDNDFVYWDTDSIVSDRDPFGQAFGTLTHYHPGVAAFAAAGYSESEANIFQRLGTARNDEELKANGHGDFVITGTTRANHRYQVLSLFPPS
jgi:hypothetical protein